MIVSWLVQFCAAPCSLTHYIWVTCCFVSQRDDLEVDVSSNPFPILHVL